MITLRLFLLFTGSLVKIIVNADDDERTWSDAYRGCNLLGSNLLGSNERGTFPSQSLAKYQDQVPTGGKMYWIAAIKKTTVPFKFNQCKSTESIDKFNFNTTNVAGSPVYDCSVFCNGDFFALSSTKCVCTELFKGTPKACQFKLFDNTNVDFYDDPDYLEYQKDSNSRLKQVSGSGGGGDCAAVIFVNGTPSKDHEFLPCNTELPSLCQQYAAGRSFSLERKNKTWADAVLSCNGILRSSFDGIYNPKPPSSDTVKAWTGISRRSIKQWSNGVTDNIIDPYECLAVSKNSDDIVKIHVRNCNETLPFLCEQSESTFVFSTQLTTSEGETTSFGVTNFSDVTAIDTTTVTPHSTSISYPHSTSVLPEGQETINSDSLVPAIAGGAAAGVIIILSIVFIVLFRRFQQKNINKGKRHSSGAVYSVVDKSRQNSSIVPEGTLIQVDTDDTYDHTVNRKSRHSVHSVQENMYDHTTVPQKEPTEDNFYDSTCRNPQKDTIINDNEYGSVNPTTGNDVYSHTNQVFDSSDADVENYDSMKNLK